MSYQFLQPWHDFLPREGGHVISLFGGGGKTSLLAAWATFYRQAGVPVAVTTTTRTEPLRWDHMSVQEWEGTTSSTFPSSTEVLYVRRGEYDNGKWRGLTLDQVDRLSEMLPERIILVETDGSAGRPVKLHRADEPVLPTRTSLVVAVVGLGAIGRPLPEILHRVGKLPAPWPPAKAMPDRFSWDHLWHLLTAPAGYLERIPPGVPKLIAFTQLASLRDSLGLFGFLDRIMEELGQPLVLLGELAEDPPRLWTAYRCQEESRDS